MSSGSTRRRRRAMAGGASRRGRAGLVPRSRTGGQSLVEFALTLPLFLLLFFGIIEFSFLLNAQLTLNFATRDASLVAAEAGSDDPDADCAILRRIEADLNPPVNDNAIVRVHIFQADVAGAKTGLEQVYVRGGGTTNCTSGTLPYQLTTNTFPYGTRCAQLLGCGTSPVESLDIVGVQIDYRYTYFTPVPALVGFGTGGSQDISSSNSMRMEPHTL